MALDAETASGAFLATRSASAMAASSAPPFSVIWLISPSSAASSARIGSPVIASSIALACPTRAGRRKSPPPAAKRPRFTSGTPNLAPSEATMRSQVNAVSRPPASANPSTAAINGFCEPLRMKFDHAEMSSPVINALRSIPAEKPLPAPVSTAAVNPSFESSSSSAVASALDCAALKAFI